MTEVAVTRISSKLNTQVLSTVKFLRDAREKGFKENVDLRTYLKTKRGLTSEQIDQAFRIVNKNSSRSEELKNSIVKDDINIHSQNDGSKDDNEHKKDLLTNEDYQTKGLSFLLPEKRALGEKALQVLMKSEVRYCAILESLQCEYYGTLANMANRNKLKMTSKEVEEIFEYIPNILMFHRDILPKEFAKGGENIGMTFLRYIKAFLVYVDYMKQCSSTINKMGKYNDDKKLHRCLTSIKKKSKYRYIDLVDLLIAPLERICEYKLFLDTLLDWADQTRQSDYDLISKAARRVGRVVEYINKYKPGIINKGEMNRVEVFVRDNWQITEPGRQIIRRGLMTRHFTGWSKRYKTFIFFLFNDVIFWTSMKGNVQNVLFLRNCELLDSDLKHNSKRKFKIVHQNEKKKRVFDLECSTEQQREHWFEVLGNAICRAKMDIKQSVTSKLENDKPNESLSSEPVHLRSKTATRSRSSSCDFKLGDCEEQEENLGYGSYESSRNFEEYDSEEFGPLELSEDTVSIPELDDIYGDSGLLGFLSKVQNSKKLELQMGEVLSTDNLNLKLNKITEEFDQEEGSEDDSNPEILTPVVMLITDEKNRFIGRVPNGSSGKVPSSTRETRSKLMIRLNDFAQEVNT